MIHNTVPILYLGKTSIFEFIKKYDHMKLNIEITEMKNIRLKSLDMIFACFRNS